MPVISLVFKISVLCWLATFLIPQPLPGKNQIHPLLQKEPEQASLQASTPITQAIDGFTYALEPTSTYKITGLVVSSYDSRSWYDIYHKNDPGNIKDLCLVWGSNINNEAYQNVKFRSGQFTCYYSWFGTDPHFNSQAFSNNHLLPATDAIKKAIRHTHRGDQVKIGGYLINYTVTKKDQVVGRRLTSVSRDDSGNGACEVLYVTRYEILRRPFIRLATLQDLFRASTILTGSISIIAFFLKSFFHATSKTSPIKHEGYREPNLK
jgi:hypothetical protein